MQFLDVNLFFAGHVPFSKPMRRSVVQRKPLLASSSIQPEMELIAFKALAENIFKAKQNVYDGIRFFDDQPTLKDVV